MNEKRNQTVSLNQPKRIALSHFSVVHLCESFSLDMTNDPVMIMVIRGICFYFSKTDRSCSAGLSLFIPIYSKKLN